MMINFIAEKLWSSSFVSGVVWCTQRVGMCRDIFWEFYVIFHSHICAVVPFSKRPCRNTILPESTRINSFICSEGLVYHATIIEAHKAD